MGNAYALKIKKINDNNLLKDIVFNNQHKIVEYIYYITKINKYYVENFRKGMIIGDFTICNILTRKEHNIVIERVEAGYFFEGLEYAIEFIPQLDKVLIVSNVIENSISSSKQIKPNTTILLGNENKYFSNFSDLDNEISSKNAKFIFYDFEEEKIIKIDYETYREADGNLKMGFELEEVSVNELFNVNRKISLKKDSEIFNNKNDICSRKQSEEKIIPSNKPNIENIDNNKETINIIEVPPLGSSGKEINIKAAIDNLNVLEKEDVLINNISTKLEVYNTDKEEINESDVNNNEEYKIEEICVLEEASKISNSTSSENLKTEESNIKYNFKQIKKKYNKFLTIYHKIDSNFNFMNIGKKIVRKSTSSTSEEKLNLVENNENVKIENTIQNKIILIKGFHLTKSAEMGLSCLKISEMDENTIEKIL